MFNYDQLTSKSLYEPAVIVNREGFTIQVEIRFPNTEEFRLEVSFRKPYGQDRNGQHSDFGEL